MRGWMSRAKAIAAGERDGVEEVNTVHTEQGLEVIAETLEPGHMSWNEAAINAGVSDIVGIPKVHRGAYYAAYARAAREQAEYLVRSGAWSE